MIGPGYAFFSRTKNFNELRVVFGGNDDVAHLYDDPAQDETLVVPYLGDLDHAPAEAHFYGSLYSIYLEDYKQLYATTSEDGDDTAIIDPLFAHLVTLIGNWTVP